MTDPVLDVPTTDDPAEFFGLLWPQIEPFISDIVATPWKPRAYREFGLLAHVFENHHLRGLPPEARLYLEGGSKTGWQVPPTETFKRAFVLMRALDRAARLIIPTALTVVSGVVMASPGAMLGALRARWRIDCQLATTDAGHVVFKGPITAVRRAEDPEACNGDNLADQFMHLGFMPKLGAGRTASFQTVLPSDFSVGDKPVSRIGIAPIAEDANDLAFEAHDREGVFYLDAVPRDEAATGIRAAKLVIKLLDAGVDLVALPELVMSPAAVAEVVAALRGRPSVSDALVVLGSGLSADKAPGGVLSYNEAVVLDGGGREIFRQRKMHHYNMAAERLRKCQLPMKGDGPHIENVAAGRRLEVRDVPGVGRLIILICEDLAQAEPGHRAASALRPDWVVTPVLDLPQREGRWTQAEALSLKSGARVVVSGSGTLGVRYNKMTNFAELDRATGLGLLFDGAQNAVRVVERGALDQDASYSVDWEPDGWPIAVVGARPR